MWLQVIRLPHLNNTEVIMVIQLATKSLAKHRISASDGRYALTSPERDIGPPPSCCSFPLISAILGRRVMTLKVG